MKNRIIQATTGVGLTGGFLLAFIGQDGAVSMAGFVLLALCLSALVAFFVRTEAKLKGWKAIAVALSVGVLIGLLIGIEQSEPLTFIAIGLGGASTPWLPATLRRIANNETSKNTD